MNIVELVQSQMNLDRIADVLNYYGVNRVHNFGSTIRCTCPIHGGDNPTSFVWKDNGLWFCHTACGRGGDVFNFVAEMENLDVETNFKEVANKVAAFTNARIGEEIAKLDATVGSTTVAGGNHVAVQVVEADGILTGITVTENDIASEAALTEEIGRAKAAEDKIVASVGLATDGSFTTPTGKHYINGATTVMDAVEKLDAQANTNAEKIAGMSVNEETRTVTIDGKSLVFTPYTAKEIQDAAGN